MAKKKAVEAVYYRGIYDQEGEQKKTIAYTAEEMQYRNFLIQRAEDAHNQRDSDLPEFDDKDYVSQYLDNCKAACGYNEPTTNEEDVRYTTGTTQEKGISVEAALLNFDFTPEVLAFDRSNREYGELGKDMADLINKSREEENWDMTRALLYKEFLDQGTVNVEDVYEEFLCPKKKLNTENWYKADPKNITWDTTQEKKCGIRTNILSGTNVYYGNIREFELKRQPYVFIREYIPYTMAKALYGNMARWMNVPVYMEHLTSEDSTSGLQYRDWTMEPLEKGMAEIVKYQDPWTNEYMLLINGVMMLPIRFPLSEVSASGGYTFAKGDAEPISKFFAYSKSTPAKMKVDQKLMDEFIRMIVLETRKSFAPPLANNTNRILSRKIFFPSTITQNVNPSQIQPISPTNGVSSAQIEAFRMIKNLVDEKSVNSVFTGDMTSQDMTATQVLEMKKQQMMKLGLTVYGVVQLERQLAWLRLFNILEYWTKPETKVSEEDKEKVEEVYKTFMVKSDFEDGTSGYKVIEFNPEKAMSMAPEQVMAEEEIMSMGKPTKYRKKYYNPEMIKGLINTWFISIKPSEKETSELRSSMFGKKIQEAMALFGPEALNYAYLKQRYASINHEDPDKFFAQNQQAQPQMEGMPENPMADQMAAPMRAPMQPSLNTLAKA